MILLAILHCKLKVPSCPFLDNSSLQCKMYMLHQLDHPNMYLHYIECTWSMILLAILNCKSKVLSCPFLDNNSLQSMMCMLHQLDYSKMSLLYI